MATNMSAVLRQGEREGQGASSTSSRRRRTSCAWEFFVLLHAAGSTGAQDRALCPTCLKELTAGSTSHLRRHKCYREWLMLINKAPPPAVPLHAAPDAAAPPPASLITDVVAGKDDVFSDLGDIVAIPDDLS